MIERPICHIAKTQGDTRQFPYNLLGLRNGGSSCKLFIIIIFQLTKKKKKKPENTIKQTEIGRNSNPRKQPATLNEKAEARGRGTHVCFTHSAKVHAALLDLGILGKIQQVMNHWKTSHLSIWLHSLV